MLTETSRAPERSWEEIRRDFPILQQSINKHSLVYLDSAASSQIPQAVIDRIVWYHSAEHSNVHRGVHTLSQRATNAYEATREKVARHLNAAFSHECIFVRGTTEGINLVAHGYGRKHFKAGDEVIVSALEHHANIVPWQIVCDEVGAKLRVIPMNDAGELDMQAYEALLNERTRLVAVNHVSNALGTINPVAEIIRLAHEKGAVVLIDGAQAVPHMAVDVQALDADFYVFSGHKIYAPTGIGVLYAKTALLEQMQPYQGGGDMIASVSFEKTTYNALPYRFEAGTPSIASGVALGAALDYINAIGLERIARWEAELLAHATEALQGVPGVRLIGTARHKASVLSFELEGVHPHDVGTILDNQGVAIRAGHHCAQPVMNRLGVAATARASFAFYNNFDDIRALVAALYTVKEIFDA
ncbi:MAG: cysteine desulfurase [Bradymonadaceae bacterium]|nr:cysteine desulfurase [Lujinxingiaceae bacterium]